MAGPRLHGVLATLAGLAALALATAPAVVAFGLGWMSLGWSSGTESFGHLVDDNSIEAWTLLALAFLVWVPLVLAGLVAVLDRLGRPYTPPEREARPTKAARRRQRAGIGYLAARQVRAVPQTTTQPQTSAQGPTLKPRPARPAMPKPQPAPPATPARRPARPAAPKSRPVPPTTPGGGAPATPHTGRGDI